MPMIISVDDLEEPPYHREMYDPIQEGCFKESIKRTNGEPIHAPFVVRNELKKNRLLSNKLKTAI